MLKFFMDERQDPVKGAVDDELVVIAADFFQFGLIIGTEGEYGGAKHQHHQKSFHNYTLFFWF
jgi:hypothetical protein